MAKWEIIEDNKFKKANGGKSAATRTAPAKRAAVEAAASPNGLTIKTPFGNVTQADVAKAKALADAKADYQLMMLDRYYYPDLNPEATAQDNTKVNQPYYEKNTVYNPNAAKNPIEYPGVAVQDNAKVNIPVNEGVKIIRDREKENYDEAYKWTSDYMKSPMYKKMLMESLANTKEFNDINNARWSNFKSMPPLQIKYLQPADHPDLGGQSWSNTGQIELFPMGFGTKGTSSHEISHSVDRPLKKSNSRIIPQLDKNYIKQFVPTSFEQGPKYLFEKQHYNSLKENDPEGYKEAVNKYKDFDINYVGEDTETRARLNAIRQGAQQNNLYDPFKEGVTPELYYDKLKNFKFEKEDKSGFDPMEQLKDVYSDEEIIYMLNHISENKKENDGTELNNLPIAKNGLLTKIKSTLNPLNIGVPDYTDKYKTWNEAYSAAKKAGLSEIMWNKGPNPGRKNLDYAGTPAQEMKSYGITGEQRVFNPSTARKNLGRLDTEKGYDTELSQVFKQLFDSKNPAVVNNEEPAYGIEKDAFRLYLGLPQEMNSFTPSKYQKGAFEIVNYNQMLPEVLDENIENLIKTKGNPEKEFKYGEHITGGNSPIKPYGDIVMGKHTVKKGKDDKGEYIEYADKWDLDSYKVGNVAVGQIADMVNKPLPIYGRVYYKDYGDGVKRKMYYTDNELKSFSTDKNNKNFNTLDLQKELVNRGYELPNSMQQDDYGNINFDGIYGNETKQALQDFQSKKTPAPKMAVSLPGQSTALPPELKHGGKVSGWQIIDDIPKFKRGGKTNLNSTVEEEPKNTVKVNQNGQIIEYDLSSPEYKKLYESGTLASYDPETDAYIPPTLKEFTVVGEKPKWAKEKENNQSKYSKDWYIDNYLPKFSRNMGISADNMNPNDVERYNSFINDKTAEDIFKRYPTFDTDYANDRLGTLKQFSPKEVELIKNSSYASALEPNVWDEFKQAASSAAVKLLTSQIPGPSFPNPYINKNLTYEEAQEASSPLNLLAPLSIPYNMIIGNAYTQQQGEKNYSWLKALEGQKPIHNSTALSIAADPLNLLGLGLFKGLVSAGKIAKLEDAYQLVKGLGKEEALSKLKSLISLDNTVKSAGKYLTEKTPLKNAYKVNPWAFKPNSEMMYRGIGETGMKDALESGVFRAKQNVEPLMEGEFNMAKQFEGTYYTPKFKTADQYGAGYIAEVPKDVTDFRLRYKGKGNKNWSQIADENIPIDKGKILQKDWLKGYKEIPKPASSFKSEINWGNWNKEIPKNKALMQEYNAIEQSTKANGSWMKNPDGSPFKGSELTKKEIIANPKLADDITNKEIAEMQFVQQYSKNFKKAFGQNNKIHYRGNTVNSPIIQSQEQMGKEYIKHKFGITDKKRINYIFNRQKERGLNTGIYTTFDKKMATEYAGNKGILQELYGNMDKAKISHTGESFQVTAIDRDNILKEGYNSLLTPPVEHYPAGENVFFNSNQLKSAIGNNGMFDMTNPNIYKSILPYIGYTGAGALTYKGLQGLGSKPILQQQKHGGIIEDPMGQWAHPGSVTRIPSNQITMQGVNYPVLGVSDRGHTQMMYPGEDYSFRGKSVTEYPMMGSGGEVNFTYAGENHRVYEKESPTGNGKGVEGHIMVNHPTENKKRWDTIDLTKITNGKVKTVPQGVASTKKWHKENPEYADGGMIKRADGSYSKRGLWDNIRDNAGSGKKPTKEMLKQERKIKSQYANGGQVSSWEIIEDLPKAGNGLINSLMATLNPKNQGVRDYTKSGTRDQAYAAARKAGVKEFMWNNERFSTDMAGTPAQQLKWSGITNSQTENRSFFTPVNFAKDRLRKNLVPYGYTNPAGRVYDAIVKDKSTPFVSEDKRTVLGLKDVSPERRDAFKLYMNNPQENNTFGISNYTPSLKDKNSNNGPYYKINNLYGDPTKDDWFVNFFYNSNKNRVTDAALPNLIKTPFDNLTKKPPTLMNFQNDIMGHYKTSIGSDERGNYMSYYDKWDLNPKEVKNPITGKEIPTDIGKPFEIYDRVYFKDYGDGEEKRMYYTDKELKSFNTDKNTKNFDTIALQKELYNRGYKLPNSVKVGANEGDLKFDGIYGDETKKALQDFQNKKVEAPKMAVQKPGQSEALPPQFKKGGKTKKSNWQIIEY